MLAIASQSAQALNTIKHHAHLSPAYLVSRQLRFHAARAKRFAC
jgi:hypothetical protein